MPRDLLPLGRESFRKKEPPTPSYCGEPPLAPVGHQVLKAESAPTLVQHHPGSLQAG